MTKLVKSVIKCNHKLYHYSLSSLNYVSLKQFSTKKSDLINGNNNISTKENNDVSRIKNDVNKEHIQIHTYRSLVTVSHDEVDPNELDLSFTERQAYKHQLKQSKINNINNFAPPIAYEIWNSPPEVYDRIYGFEVDCEPPDRHNISWNWLYKLWGYYTQKEIRHRCSLYTFMKAQRRCQNNQFWDTFDLENTFRVEIQLLCLHLWIAKTRILMFDYKSAQKLSYKTFKCFFDQLPNRFNKNKHGLKSGWIKDCQQACIHFAISLDNAFDDYNNGDNESFGKVIWNELYLSNNDIEHDLLYLWSQYILINIKHLKFNVDDNCFYNGWWKFQNIPTNNDRQNIRNIIINNYNNNNDINIFDNLRDFLNNHNNNDITNNNNHSIS